MRNAFTLVELLVVITIIVLLLALLMPAMEQAIYQAELAACGAQQRSISSGVVTYAMENRRYYPNPPSGRAGQLVGGGGESLQSETQAHQVDQLGSWGVPRHFLLGLLEPFMSRQVFNCRLTGRVSYDPQDNEGVAGKPTELFSTYGLWFSLRYNNADARAAGLAGRYRLGDKLEYVDENDPARRPLTFGVLVGDMNAIDVNDTSFSSHPDRDGVLAPARAQDAFNGYNYVTFSRWFDGNANAPVRGALDLNFSFDDLHTERLSDVGFRADRRTFATPHQAGGGGGGTWRQYIPR